MISTSPAGGSGKFYQFFLNLGTSTNADQAIVVSREVYRQGIGGMWIQYLVLFLTPFYWFTTGFFRRVRLVTIGDFFSERFKSRFLGGAFAVFTLFMAFLGERCRLHGRRQDDDGPDAQARRQVHGSGEAQRRPLPRIPGPPAESGGGALRGRAEAVRRAGRAVEKRRAQGLHLLHRPGRRSTRSTRSSSPSTR